ncbi:hypothetical protein FOL47_000924 [Perkinsus chesapeaki]|uniref:Uncharacterized protein n=1 Tax=Perkinsus chesapeaki TaxID=330153 RepID=A0A7J6N1C9_PERCH|nr:hypothetical protein FOL47_000924 [Perkinsus chesapeaki]
MSVGSWRTEKLVQRSTPTERLNVEKHLQRLTQTERLNVGKHLQRLRMELYDPTVKVNRKLLHPTLAQVVMSLTPETLEADMLQGSNQNKRFMAEQSYLRWLLCYDVLTGEPAAAQSCCLLPTDWSQLGPTMSNNGNRVTATVAVDCRFGPLCDVQGLTNKRFGCVPTDATKNYINGNEGCLATVWVKPGRAVAIADEPGAITESELHVYSSRPFHSNPDFLNKVVAMGLKREVRDPSLLNIRL